MAASVAAHRSDGAHLRQDHIEKLTYLGRLVWQLRSEIADCTAAVDVKSTSMKADEVASVVLNLKGISRQLERYNNLLDETIAALTDKKGEASPASPRRAKTSVQLEMSLDSIKFAARALLGALSEYEKTCPPKELQEPLSAVKKGGGFLEVSLAAFAGSVADEESFGAALLS